MGFDDDGDDVLWQAFRSILDMLLRGLFTFADLYTQIGKLKRTSVRYFDLLDGKPEIESIRTWSPNHPMWAKSTRSPKEQVDVNNYNFEGRLAFEVRLSLYVKHPRCAFVSYWDKRKRIMPICNAMTDVVVMVMVMCPSSQYRSAILEGPTPRSFTMCHLRSSRVKF